MRKLVNARKAVLISAGLAAGIICSYFTAYYESGYITFAVVVPTAAAIFILAVIFSKRKAVPAMILLITLSVILGGAISSVNLISYQSNDLNPTQSYYVTGVISESGKTSSGANYIIISNAKAGDIPLRYKIYASVSERDANYCNDGYNVSFTAKLSKSRLFSFGALNYDALNNVKYRCTVTSEFSCRYRFSPFAYIRGTFRQTLFDNADSDTAGIAFAMLTGNTQAMDADALNAMRFGGVAHIFAVSGLHIGVIFGIFAAIFKKLKLNKHLAAALTVLFIVIYSGVCGFTASSLRAVIMCTVLTVSKLFYKKYDPLNSLALSAFIILLISPLSLFSAGFQLSFASVAGIICLSRNISRVIPFLPRKIKDGIGVSISAQIASFPVMISTFGYVSAAGLLMNIVFVPLLSAIYCELFLFTVISAVIPQIAGGVIPFALAPLEGIASLLSVCGFENALIYGFGSAVFIPLYFIGAFALSDKINFNKIARVIALLLSLSSIAVYALVGIYSPINGFKISVSGDVYGGGYALIKSKFGTVAIITDSANQKSFNSLLKDGFALKLDACVVLGGEDCAAKFLKTGITCKNAYFAPQYLPVQPYGDTVFNYKKSFETCGVLIEYVDGYTVKADVDGVKVAVTSSINPLDYDCDLVVSKFHLPAESKSFAVYFSLENEKYSCEKQGVISFKINLGKLALRNKLFIR